MGGGDLAAQECMKNEPQSYGSQAEWVTGKTGRMVNREPERRVDEVEAIAAQPGESDPPGRAAPIAESEQPVQKVTSTPTTDDNCAAGPRSAGSSARPSPSSAARRRCSSRPSTVSRGVGTRADRCTTSSGPPVSA